MKRVTIGMSDGQYKELEDRMFLGRYRSMTGYILERLFDGGVKTEDGEREFLKDRFKTVERTGTSCEVGKLPEGLSDYVVPKDVILLFEDDLLLDGDRELSSGEFDRLKEEGLKFYPRRAFGMRGACLKKFSVSTKRYHVVKGFGDFESEEGTDEGK